MSHREKRKRRKGKREGRREQASEGGREQGGGSTSGVLITSESCIILYNMFYISVCCTLILMQAECTGSIYCVMQAEDTGSTC